MKKIYSILIILLLTTACSFGYLKDTNLKNLNKKLDNKESFILYITNEDESGITLKNTLKSVLKENKVTGYNLNVSKLDDNELKKLKEKFMFKETNIVIFVNKGIEETVLSRITDIYISNDDLTNELKLQGFIK